MKIPASSWCNLGVARAYSFGIVASRKRKRKPVLRHRLLIGEASRSHRKAAGFTQEKLAERVNLNPKYLGEIERGEKIVSIEALLRIAKAVKTPMPEFFRGI
jgi:DNA-binding XRE family transcriptional regulator